MLQITKNQDSNWNIYQDTSGSFWSIAINPQCQNTFYCKDINHIISLIYKYNAFKISDFTEYGLKLIDEYLKAHRFTRQNLFKNIA